MERRTHAARGRGRRVEAGGGGCRSHCERSGPHDASRPRHKAGRQPVKSLMPVACALAALLLGAAPARAQYGSAPQRSNPVNEKPGILKNVGIDQKIGQQLPLDLQFRDESGRDVRLGENFGARPVVLALAYYDCPMLKYSRSEEHTSELQSPDHLVCRLLLD